jgi:hypothetical protein
VGGFDSGRSWWDQDFAEHVAAQVHEPALAARARELLGRMEVRGGPWVWKDPALCHFLPFWRVFWASPVFIVAVRNPLDIATSWQQFRTAGGRSATSLRCNLLRWQHMTLCALRGTDQVPSTLFVEYEQLIRAPSEQAARLARFLDAHCDNASNRADVRRMAATCVPALRRNRHGHRREDVMSVSQNALYRFLRSKVAAPDRRFRDEYPMPPGWRAAVMEEESR